MPFDRYWGWTSLISFIFSLVPLAQNRLNWVIN
jgi:hypothetical protein